MLALPVDVRDGEGNTPLHIAVGNEGGDESAVEALLDLGADVNALTPLGRTPLIIAIDEGHNTRIVVPLLLARGANVRQVTTAGISVHEYAIQSVQIWEKIVADHKQETGENARPYREQALAEARNILEIIEAELEK
ncbi:MAG: ankyrin repeat domain-containing protein [Chloroflexota bacterium]